LDFFGFWTFLDFLTILDFCVYLVRAHAISNDSRDGLLCMPEGYIVEGMAYIVRIWCARMQYRTIPVSIAWETSASVVSGSLKLTDQFRQICPKCLANLMVFSNAALNKSFVGENCKKRPKCARRPLFRNIVNNGRSLLVGKL
jgi:hypothetical protein